MAVANRTGHDRRQGIPVNTVDADLEAAVEARLSARMEELSRRRVRRQRQSAEFSERRRHGLKARHARKLARANKEA